jgi:hypothetical protein
MSAGAQAGLQVHSIVSSRASVPTTAVRAWSSIILVSGQAGEVL